MTLTQQKLTLVLFLTLFLSLSYSNIVEHSVCIVLDYAAAHTWPYQMYKLTASVYQGLIVFMTLSERSCSFHVVSFKFDILCQSRAPFILDSIIRPNCVYNMNSISIDSICSRIVLASCKLIDWILCNNNEIILGTKFYFN